MWGKKVHGIREGGIRSRKKNKKFFFFMMMLLMFSSSLFHDRQQ